MKIVLYITFLGFIMNHIDWANAWVFCVLQIKKITY